MLPFGQPPSFHCLVLIFPKPAPGFPPPYRREWNPWSLALRTIQLISPQWLNLRDPVNSNFKALHLFPPHSVKTLPLSTCLSTRSFPRECRAGKAKPTLKAKQEHQKGTQSGRAPSEKSDHLHSRLRLATHWTAHSGAVRSLPSHSNLKGFPLNVSDQFKNQIYVSIKNAKDSPKSPQTPRSQSPRLRTLR